MNTRRFYNYKGKEGIMPKPNRVNNIKIFSLSLEYYVACPSLRLSHCPWQQIYWGTWLRGSRQQLWIPAAVDTEWISFQSLGFGKEGGPGWTLWLSMELHPWVSSYMEPISLGRRRPLRGSAGGEGRVHPGKWERLVQTPGVPAQESSS